MLIFIRLIFIAANENFQIYGICPCTGGWGDDEMSKYENKGGKAIVCVHKHTISRGLGACSPGNLVHFRLTDIGILYESGLSYALT